MPIETTSLALKAYLTVLVLGGISCFIHFVFLLKAPKRIRETEGKVPQLPLHLSEFILGIFTILLLAFLTASAVDLLTHDRVEERLQKMLMAGAVQLAALLGLFAFLKVFPKKFSAPFNGTSMGWAEAFKISLYTFLIMIPVFWPLAGAWKLFIEYFHLPAQQQEPVLWLAEAESLTLLLTMTVATIVLAPLTEELLFRGCLYRFLKSKLPLVFALLLSGVLFALVHFNLLSLLPLFFLGVILAYAYERTGSIKVPILIHGIFNANTIMLIVLTAHLS